MSPRSGAPVRPELGPAVTGARPVVRERTLANGLRVLAVRRPAVPLVEVRLRLPFAGTAPSHLARAALLAESFFTGTDRYDAHALAEAIQALGGSLGAGVDADRFALGGSALAENLAPLLGLVGDLLTENTYPSGEVAGERERLAEEVGIARRSPGTLAGEAVSRRLFGAHPYGRDLATPEEVRAVTPAALRRLHAQRFGPAGALLVIVGDLAPARALDVAEAALGGWTQDGRVQVALPNVPAFVPGGISLVDRPGSVQTSIRLVAPAPRRSAPDYAALALANTVFAGYFSSRLVANIREDKGYTYSPHASVNHTDLASFLVVDADVATEVTAPAIVETYYEMAKSASLPMTREEIDAARRYLLGTLALSTASQAGLATTLARLYDAGLDAGWLREHPAALARAGVEESFAAAQRWLAPSASATVLVGDASVVAGPVGALDTVTPMVLDGPGAQESSR